MVYPSDIELPGLEKYPQMKKLSRFIQRLVSHPRITIFFSRFISKVDLVSLRYSNGKFSPTSKIAGWTVITLTTTGAKSGQLRTTPLIGILDGGRIILVGSNFGRHSHPAWYYNLKANPMAIIERNGSKVNCLARETNGEEYERLWHIALEINPGYESYRQQTKRKIPIFILEPQD